MFRLVDNGSRDYLYVKGFFSGSDEPTDVSPEGATSGEHSGACST